MRSNSIHQAWARAAVRALVAGCVLAVAAEQLEQLLIDLRAWK